MGTLSNARHERFAQALATGASAQQAYADAGYRQSRSNASVLRAKQIISERVEELLMTAASETSVTIQSIAKQLDADWKLAHDRGQAGAAVAASMAKARLFGLIKEHDTAVASGNVSINNVVVQRIVRVVVDPTPQLIDHDK